jgi:hypothetical protein
MHTIRKVPPLVAAAAIAGLVVARRRRRPRTPDLRSLTSF